MSSSSQRPPALSCGRLSISERSISRKLPGANACARSRIKKSSMSRSRKRMAPVWSERPRSLAVETIEECQVRVETRLVEWPIFLGEGKGVLSVVKIAKLDALRARIASRVCQDEILDLRPPETFDSDRLAAARDDVFRDGGDQCHAIESFDDWSKRDLDDDRQDVAKLNGVCGRIKGQFARKIRAERGLDIHEERVADQSREDAHAILFQLAPQRRSSPCAHPM